jgi:cell shape-determining protein MreD
MRSLIFIPILIIGVILQSTIISQFSILSGFADLMLLVLVSWSINTDDKLAMVWAIVAGGLVSIFSAMSPIVPILGYVIAVSITKTVIKRTWQVPMIAVIFSTIISTLVVHFLSIGAIWINSNFSSNIVQLIQIITVPSLFLNILLILPVNSLMKDVSHWVFPETEIE